MYVDPDKAVEEKRAAYREELRKNEAVWKHFADYDEEDVEKLIDDYALDKAMLKVQGNYTRHHHEGVLREWTGRSWFGLCEIQHKKLFDMQCLWRAGEIGELPGIRWTCDFEHLPCPILDYEAVPDITPEEVADYLSFLKTPNGQATFHYDLGIYQSYATIKTAHFEDKGSMPEYYEYHNVMTGNSGLLSLPDVRTPEEMRLLDLVAKHNKKTDELARGKQAPAQPAPQKKWLNYRSDEVKIELAGLLGERDMAAFIKDLAKWMKEKPEWETNWAMNYLSWCHPEDVPIPAALRWQDALEKAVLQHITLHVQEILPGIYEEYQLKKKLGVSVGDVMGEMKYRSDKHPLAVMLEMAERIEKRANEDTEDAFDID